MTAPKVSELLTALEQRLLTVIDLRTAAYMADQVNPPMAVVGVPPIDNYRATFTRGKLTMEFQVYVLVSGALDRIGQQTLSEYMDVVGEKSIPLAIEGDRTLGGLADDCVVRSFRPLGIEEVNAIGYYGGVFQVLVVVSGT